MEEVNVVNNLIVTTPEEFFETIGVAPFEDERFTRYTKSLLDGATKTGENSAVGQVFVKDNFVVKVSNYCPPNQSILMQQLCSMSKNKSLVFYVPDSIHKKKKVLIPNYLLEGIVGMYLSAYASQFTPGFVNFYGLSYLEEEHSTYTLMEKLDISSNYVSSIESFVYTLLSLTFTLLAGQRLCRFVHYDLHEDNYMVRTHEQKIQVYTLPNGRNIYTYFNFTPVLIDYGHSRMETDDYILTPRMRFEPADREMLDFYDFNPYYDLFSVIYTNCLKAVEGRFAWKSNTVRSNADGILAMLFGAETGGFQKAEERVMYPANYDWRPVPEKLSYYTSDMKPIQTPSVYLQSLAEHIRSIQSLDPSTTDPSIIAKCLNETGICMVDTLVDIPGAEIYTLPSDGMDINTLPFSMSNDDSFDSIQIRTFINDTTNLHLHEAIIPRMKEYDWQIDCCRIDVRNKLQSNDVRSGIAINGGFFAIRSDFTPIGDYLSNGVSFTSNVPKIYEEWYGAVVITHRGRLDIITLRELRKDTSKYKAYFTSGPILVRDSEIVFTEDMIDEDEVDGVKIWKCRAPGRGEYDDKILDSGEFSCNFINPGELSHAGNLNPRSVLGIYKTGEVSMIYVEGREQRGPGAQLGEMAKLCHDNGMAVAINLDGGRSSQMFWKKESQGVIFSPNPDHTYAYPVGSILSYVKM